MDKLHLWVGTFSDETIIRSLKKNESPMIYLDYEEREMMTDYAITKNIIEKGMIRDCLTWFYAKNLAKAKSMAKQMGLKNFSKVCEELYEEGKHY